jgi:hypothetical protein
VIPSTLNESMKTRLPLFVPGRFPLRLCSERRDVVRAGERCVDCSRIVRSNQETLRCECRRSLATNISPAFPPASNARRNGFPPTPAHAFASDRGVRVAIRFSARRGGPLTVPVAIKACHQKEAMGNYVRVGTISQGNGRQSASHPPPMFPKHPKYTHRAG